MRILSVGNMYPPHSFGGYEQVWHAAVEHLHNLAHEVRVLTTNARTATNEPDDADVHRELRWHLRDGEFEELSWRSAVAMTRHNHRVLRTHLDAYRPDVVAWWSMGGLTLTLLEAVRRRGLPAAAFVHDEWLDYGRKVDPWLAALTGPRRGKAAPVAERLFGIPARVQTGTAAAYAFVSETTRQQAIDAGVEIRRSMIAHSGIHHDYLNPAPVRQWNWRLLYVGRIDLRKGVDTAVRALTHLPEARLTVIGGWNEAEERRLAQLAEAHGVRDRLTFAGQQQRSKVFDAYAEADAVVFPVRWREPWGLVPLEAMGRGRPVVATGRGGSGEYLRDGENCVLFDAEDPRDLATAVRRLAFEESLRLRLRENGFRTAERHTEATFNAAVEQVLHEAVSQPFGTDALGVAA